MIPLVPQPEVNLFWEFTIHGWGVMVCLGIILGTNLAAKRSEVIGHDPDIVHDYAVWAVISGFIGAHLIEVIFYQPEKLREDPLELLKFWQGFSSFGGFLGAAVGSILFFRRKKARFLDYCDALALGFAAAWTLGRTGCFLAHDHVGRQTDFFLGVRNTSGITYHELGLYEALLSAALTLVMWFMRDVRGRGVACGTLFILYAPVRLGLDFFRKDYVWGGLTIAQYLCVPLLLAGVLMVVRGRREAAATVQAAEITA